MIVDVPAVPVEVVEVKTSVEEPPFPVQATAPFAQCKSNSYLLWPPGRPGRLQPGVNCLLPFRRSIIHFSLRCHHSLRLQHAATEHDGVRCFAQQVQAISTRLQRAELCRCHTVYLQRTTLELFE